MHIGVACQHGCELHLSCFCGLRFWHGITTILALALLISVLSTAADTADLTYLSLLERSFEACEGGGDTDEVCLERAVLKSAEAAKFSKTPELGQQFLDHGPSLAGSGRGWRGWRHILQTPRRFWPELRAPTLGLWWVADAEKFRRVTGAVSQVRRELRRDVLRAPRPPPAMRHRGAWMQRTVWTPSEGWRASSCSDFASLCAVLRGLLPTTRRPLLTKMQEIVELFGMPPNTSLDLHNDGGNDRVSMSMCIVGCAGAWLTVAGQTRRWGREGGWLLFDPSWDHSAGNDGSEERWVVNVNVAHPDYDDPERFQSIERWTSEWFLQCDTMGGPLACPGPACAPCASTSSGFLPTTCACR